MFMSGKKMILCFLVMAVILTGCAESSSTEVTNTKTEEVTLYIARHGKTMLNTTDRSQGWIDAPLTPAGVEVAEDLGKGLKNEGITFDAVITSDSGRAIETAEIVLENNGQEDMILKMTKDKRLREFNFGTYEGMPNEEMQEAIANKQGMTMEEWLENLQKVGFVKSIADFADTIAEADKENVEEGVNWNAEDYQTIVERSTSAIDEIVKNAQENGYENILVVSHGMTIATLTANLDPSAEMEIPATGLKNASITKITYKNGKYSVDAVNDMTYVENGGK